MKEQKNRLKSRKYRRGGRLRSFLLRIPRTEQGFSKVLRMAGGRGRGLCVAQHGSLVQRLRGLGCGGQLGRAASGASMEELKSRRVVRIKHPEPCSPITSCPAQNLHLGQIKIRTGSRQPGAPSTTPKRAIRQAQSPRVPFLGERGTSTLATQQANGLPSYRLGVYDRGWGRLTSS